MVVPQTAKQAIVMPSSPPLHPSHPPGIGMSPIEALADILTAISDACTSCVVPATTSVRARNRAIKWRTFSDIAHRIAASRAKSQTELAGNASL